MATQRTPDSPGALLVKPPVLGLVRLRIPGFTMLSPSERLQAAALALSRDLGLAVDDLRLATVAVSGANDEAMVAYVRAQDAPAGLLATHLLGVAKPGEVFWVDAPAGFVVTGQGAAAIEPLGSGDQGLPSLLLAALGSSADGSGMANARCTLVNRDVRTLTDETLNYWCAASGFELVDGTLPTVATVPLVAPVRARLKQRSTSLDRALRWATAAAIICMLLAAFQYANVGPATAMGYPDGNSNSAANKAHHASAGALLDRLGSIAPDIVAQAQNATYASGAWVLLLPDAFDADSLQRAALLAQANGLLLQSAQATAGNQGMGNGPRVRLSLP